MPRVLAIRCTDCGRKFSGDETMKRHRYLAGDRYACYSNNDLVIRRGYRFDLTKGVWYRPRLDQMTLPSLSVTPQDDTDPRLLARTSDPITSKVAARVISYRTGTHKALLLGAYLEEPSGLTDEEAAARIGMALYEATKRCADLRRDGAIVPTGTRKGRAGLERMVCRAVEAGAA